MPDAHRVLLHFTGRFLARGEQILALFNGEEIARSCGDIEGAACRALVARGLIGRLEFANKRTPNKIDSFVKDLTVRAGVRLTEFADGGFRYIRITDKDADADGQAAD